MADNEEHKQAGSGPWPEPRLARLQVEEIYGFAPSATAFSYFGALLTLGVLIGSGDIGRGAVWFLWATGVTFFRSTCIVAYRRRSVDSDPVAWGRLMIAANFLAGVQWGVLGTLLFPEGPAYLQLFTLMVIICFVAGSVTAYAAVRGAHEALSIPATVPTAIYLFFVMDGVHWYAGLLAIFFCTTIIFYATKLHRHLEQGFRMQIERDDLITLTGMLNEKLERENRELAHRVAVRGVSAESARERADRLEALFERSALPQIECDAAGHVIVCNPAAERLFGLRLDQMAGKSLTTFLKIPETEISTLAHAPQAEIFHVEAHTRDGGTVSCTASFTPFPEAPGRRPGFGVVLTGIPVIVM
ncbi:MAG: PAS domain S-box protein [Usitatibacter sp.]